MFALWRIVTILLGYAAAVLITIISLNIFMDILGWATRPRSYSSYPSPPITGYIWKYTLSLVQGFFLVGAGVAALPAFVVVIISELRAWRSIRPYSWGGAGVGAACHLALLSSLLLSKRMPPSWPDWLFLVGSILPVMAIGALAGTAYWLIAGRSAGQWRWADVSGREGRSGDFVRRIAVVVFGYLIACFAVALMLISIGLVFFGIPLAFPWVLLQAFGGMTVFGILPALFVIMCGEMDGRTTLPFYLISGLVVVTASFLSLMSYVHGFSRYISSFDNLTSSMPVAAWLVISGCIAGVTYWAIAGRNAGQWRDARVQ